VARMVSSQTETAEISAAQTSAAQISAAQRRLLDAAVDAFAEQGFGGTSTRDIAVRAGRSQAAVYVHYESKEALLYAVSVRGHADALGCLQRAYRATDDPVRRLHGMVFAFSRWHTANARLGRVVQYEFRALSDEHRAEIVALRRRFHRLVVDALHDGIRAGDFHVENIDGTARALLSLCVDLVRWFDPTRTRAARALARLNADLALRMVAAPPLPR
jgi:AcrR family transcriptional regulator